MLREGEREREQRRGANPWKCLFTKRDVTCWQLRALLIKYSAKRLSPTIKKF